MLRRITDLVNSTIAGEPGAAQLSTSDVIDLIGGMGTVHGQQARCIAAAGTSFGVGGREAPHAARFNPVSARCLHMGAG